MTKAEILESVFGVYGHELKNCRSSFSAKDESPVPMLAINKAFRSWNKFYIEYMEYCVQERTKAAEVVVTKKESVDDDVSE